MRMIKTTVVYSPIQHHAQSYMFYISNSTHWSSCLCQLMDWDPKVLQETDNNIRNVLFNDSQNKSQIWKTKQCQMKCIPCREMLGTHSLTHSFNTHHLHSATSPIFSMPLPANRYGKWKYNTIF